MKIYKTKAGIVIENEANFFLLKNENWDAFINDDHLLQKAQNSILTTSSEGSELINELLAPVGQQELWA